MADDTDNTVDIDDTNLDDFENEFYERDVEKNTPEDIEENVDENEEDNPLATEDDDEGEDADGEAADDDSEEEEVEEVPQPKQKRNRAQERIEQLLERERLANERATALEQRLAALESGKEVNKEEAPQALRESLPADAPSPDAKDKDGNLVYELGEFDPKFIRDLTKYTIAEETKAAKAESAKEAQIEMVKAAQAEIQTKWNENLETVETEIPEIRENISHLTTVFQTLEPNYGEYLASTIMASDFGPQIMNYFSQNIGEAQKIVASGPAAATLAIGRLEARFVKPSTEQEEKSNTSKQVSKASPPPEDKARGRGGRFSVADDTDDLEAFERKFFK